MIEKCIILCLVAATVLTENQNLTPDNIEDWSILDQIFDKNYNETQTEYSTENVQNIFIPTDHKQNVKTFDWILLKAVDGQSKIPNVLISPIGIKTMLTILFELADDGTPTKRQLEQVNPKGNWYLTGPELREPYEKRITSLQTNSFSYNVDFATRVFVDERVEPKQRLTEIVMKYYRAAFEQVQFNNTDDTMLRINDWSSRLTRENIPSILETDSLIPMTALVAIANVAHFQALWAFSFKDETISGKFYSPDGLVDATYMRSIDRFYYLDSEDLNAKIIRLPYAGRKFSMFIVLPHQKKNGLTQLVEDFTRIDLTEILREMDPTAVSVLLPQFKMDYKLDLNKVMHSLQIERIFTANASISSLAVPKDAENFPEGAPVSRVVHACSFEMNRKNSMSTTSGYADSNVDVKITKFEAAWPFLFFVMDETTNGILFSGTVRKPEVKE